MQPVASSRGKSSTDGAEMSSINPDAIPPEIRIWLEALVAQNADPLALAIAAWNASAEYEQGARYDPQRD